MSNISQEAVHEMVPYTKTLGMRFPVITAERVEAVLEASASLSTIGGGSHGGAVYSLADAAAAVLATAVHADGSGPATSESSVHFLEPAIGRLVATAVPLRAGRSSVIVSIEVHREDGKLCAVSTQTVARISRD